MDCLKPKTFRNTWKYQKDETFDVAKLPKLFAYLSVNIAGPLTYGLAAIAVRKFLNKKLGETMWQGLTWVENLPFTTSLYKVEKTLPSFFEVCRQRYCKKL